MKNSNIEMRQIEQEAIISIEAHTDSSQTMVKLCKNDKEWLSPTGWNTTEKSTLLDSERVGNTTEFSIPDEFATSLNNGDTLKLSVASIDFEGSIIWAREEVATTSSMLAMAIAKTKKQSRRKLFGRLGSEEKAEEVQQSEIERLAEQARLAAEASSEEMQRAREAKQAAEQRALEAARLAEAAHKMEQDVIAEAKRAEEALVKAETARRAEEKRKQAERKAEEARLREQARLAELAKRKEQARQLEAQCRAEIERMEAELATAKDAVRTFENRAGELVARAQKAEEFVKSQNEIAAQAKRTFALAERKALESEAESLKCQQAEHATKDQYARLEKELAEQKKKTTKAASHAQKAKSAHSEAELAAKAAIARANELKIAAQSAEDNVQSLQRQLKAAQQHAKELATQKDRAEAAQISVRTTLEQAKTTLGAARASLKDASAVHAEAGNNLRQTEGLITENHGLLQETRALEKQLRIRIKHLKAQKITPDNVEELADILTADPKLKTESVIKAAALASGAGGAALVMAASATDDAATESQGGVISRLKNLFHREQGNISPEQDVEPVPETPEKLETETQNAEPVQGTVEVRAGIGENKTTDQAETETVAVKLVSETDEQDLLVSGSDESDHEEEQNGKSRKMVVGLSAVLLASVASIGLVNVLSSGPVSQQATSVEKTRIEAQAVLPAAVTTAPQVDYDLKKKIIDTQNLGTPPAEASVSAREEQVDEEPVVRLAENTVEIPALTHSMTSTAPALGIHLAEVEDAFFPQKSDELSDTKNLLAEPAQEPAPVEEASLRIPAQAAPAIRPEEKSVKIAVPAKKPVAKKRPAKQAVSLPAKPKTITVKEPEPEPVLETPLAFEKQTAPGPVPLQFSELTRDVQIKLQALGFYQGEPNGFMDANTTSAINSFEEAFGLEVSGKVTAIFLRELDNIRITQTPIQARPIQETSVAEPETVLEASLTPAPVNLEMPKESEPKPDLIVEAKKTASGTATYPNIAMRRGHDKDTTVVVTYDVDANGAVTNTRIKEIIGAGRFKKVFEKAAIKAAKKASFSPKMVNGKAVTSQDHETKFTFNLE